MPVNILLLISLATLGGVVPLTLLVSRAKAIRRIAIFLILTACVASGAAAALGFLSSPSSLLHLAWVTPFSLQLGIDRLSALFLLLISSIGVPVTLFAAPYFSRHYSDGSRRWMWIFLSLFLFSMMLVVTAASGFAFLVGWELMTLFSAALILAEGHSPERQRNVFIYLLMMHAGAAAVAAAFWLLLPFSHTLDFQAIRASSAALPERIRITIFLIALIGFGTKAGLIPLHLWLPRAHPIAPSPISALMSGVMLKTAVYGFVRFLFDFLDGGPWWSGYIVLLAAAVTGLLGILYAIAENDLKRLLAYSSVENIGIIFLGLGASLIFLQHHALTAAALALVAALLHAWNHAWFKSLLFLGAGSLSDSAHTVDLNALGGLQRRMPFTGLAMLLGCCSIAGLPLGNGFVSEWLTFRSLLAGAALSGTRAQVVLPLLIGILALIGGLAASCFVKVFGTAFLGRPRSAGADNAQETPLGMRAGLAVLSLGCIGMGIFPGIVLPGFVSIAQALIPGSAPPPETASIARVLPLIAAIIAGVAAMAMIWKRSERSARTWACGLPGLTPRMQYTSSVFSKPIRFVFGFVYRPDRRVERTPADAPYFPSVISYRSIRTTSYERALYRPFVEAVVALAHRVRRLQTGNIQVYLLYIFLALVLLLVFLRLYP